MIWAMHVFNGEAERMTKMTIAMEDIDYYPDGRNALCVCVCPLWIGERLREVFFLVWRTQNLRSGERWWFTRTLMLALFIFIFTNN